MSQVRDRVLKQLAMLREDETALLKKADECANLRNLDVAELAYRAARRELGVAIARLERLLDKVEAEENRRARKQ